MPRTKPLNIFPSACENRLPYTLEHIRRFAQYVLDMDGLPDPLEPRPLPFEPAL